MIVDHRTYTAYPGKLADFTRVYEESGYPLQKHYLGDCVGWYISMDIGELNQAIHLWRYKDLADRAERRARLNADPEWHKYLAQALPLLQKMENKIVTATPFFTADA
ncbi:MAG: NIPSNAP family protein [Gammaproteobacteria bacterium]|nr:NIPSNAP family protein [Gammaproteobacteria bacterium]